MKVAIIGTGVFGYAIADKLYKNKHEIIMWSESKEKVEALKSGKLQIFEDKKIPKDITFTDSFEEALKNTDIIFIMVAAQYISNVCKDMLPYVTKKHHFCIGSKGIEQKSCRFVHQVFADYIHTKNLSIISGPTFAIDLVNNEPLALSIAGLSNKTKEIVIKALASDNLKLRKSSDMLGIELCGSIKNVIAIASGIIEGLGYSDGTRSFLIVESMHDIKNLMHALGGKKKTILSFAGIGDLMMTAGSTKSRNYSYGVLLGKKDFKAANKYLEETTVEGYHTLKSIYTLLRRKKIKMPVINLIYGIVMNGKDPEILIEFLINKD